MSEPGRDVSAPAVPAPDPTVPDVPGLAAVLSEQGWPYASSPPIDAADPGRFHALFGRDSLITSLQLLPVRPDVARATLRALAARQGRRHDAATLEAPGKIGHEFRDAPPASFLEAGWPVDFAGRGQSSAPLPGEAPPGRAEATGRGQHFAYYGTADATSWFLVVLAALGDPRLTGELAVHWRAASAWLDAELEDGGGLLRHRPGSRPALTQQGWRDAHDPVGQLDGGGILRPDGTEPEPPLADADTQAVTVAALRAVARLSGDPRWSERAAAMRRLVTDRYLPDVMLLEAGDRPVRGAGSQLGWLLWADAIDDDAADDVARRLCRPDIRTAFGLRTVAATEPVFLVRGYHRGAVWPFDSWLGWAGLRAAGRRRRDPGLLDAAERVRRGVLDAVAALGHFPELYFVDDEGRLLAAPVGNRIQAWTVGASWALEHGWDARPST